MKKFQTAVIDYGMGNLFSVKQACEHVGMYPVVTSDKTVLLNSDAAILPGVGAFGDAMNNLKDMDLVKPIEEFVRSGRPFMGICLGLQLLMTESEEIGRHRGLNIIEGSVVRFPATNNAQQRIKVPHIGWNHIYSSPSYGADYWIKSPLKGIKKGECMYFVHSYYAIPKDSKVILSSTDYEGTEYCSSIFWKNIFACQFHPEKSGQKGLTIYGNFSLMISDSNAGKNYG
jgi:glutamine amidotransferase